MNQWKQIYSERNIHRCQLKKHKQISELNWVESHHQSLNEHSTHWCWVLCSFNDCNLHKVQRLRLDTIVVSLELLRQRKLNYGRMYVALRRATSFSGLYIVGVISGKVIRADRSTFFAGIWKATSGELFGNWTCWWSWKPIIDCDTSSY